MTKLIFSRLAAMAVTLFVIVTATFFLVRLAPGGPFDLAKPLPPAVQVQIEAKWGLNLPKHVQYVKFLGNLARGDLGPSMLTPARQVKDILAEGLPVTMKLGAAGLGIALIIGVFAGIIAARKHGKWLDHFVVGGSTIGIVVPEFVSGPVLIIFLVFGLGLDLVSAVGWGEFKYTVLPVVTLALYYIAVITRRARGGMLEVLRQEYILAARARGLSGKRVILKHSLWMGLNPVLTYVGLAAAGIFGGATLVVEKMFNVPGIAHQFVDAVINRDYSMIMGTTIVFSAILLAVNAVVDVAYVVIDPKQRRSSA